MVDQVEKGHGWLAHELKRLGLLSWVQKNAPKLKTFAHNLGKPALTVGTNLGKAVFSTILALTTIAFLSLFMLLEAPGLRKGLLGTLKPGRREEVEDVGHQVSRQVSCVRARHHRHVAHVRCGHLRHPDDPRGAVRVCSSDCGSPSWR